jgi:hypothetical protein
MKKRQIGIFAILTGTSLALGGCGPTENISITAVNHPNQTGGNLEITGSGFTANSPVEVGITNAPGLTAPWHQAAGKTTNGNIDVTVTYTYPGTATPLPGCQVGSTDVVKLNVTAADSSSNKFGATTVAVPNCGWATPQVTNHQ